MTDKKRGGWFKFPHEAFDLIAEHFPAGRRAYALATYTALLKLKNERRREETFEASNKEVAALAGISEDTLERLLPGLAALGLASREKGTRGHPNRWQVPALSGSSTRSQRVGYPLPAGEVPAHSGSTRARPQHGEEEEREEEKKKAPDGARSLSSSSEDATGRVLDVHRETITNHNGAPPAPPTARDRRAARAWLDRVGDDPNEPWVEAMTFALSDPFWAQKVATFADFDRQFDKLIAAAHAAEAKRLNARCRGCRGAQEFVGELDDDGLCDDCSLMHVP